MPFAGNEQMAGASEYKQGSVLDMSRTQQTCLCSYCAFSGDLPSHLRDVITIYMLTAPRIYL